MFAQLLCYVRDARKKGEHIPPFLAVIDREKAALMETAKALPILTDKSITWPKSGSEGEGKGDRVTQQVFCAQVAPYVETHFVVYRIDSHEKEFIAAVKHAITAGKFVRTPITPDNLRQVFDKWVAMIGRELEGVDESDYALLFFADIMHDGSKAAMANLSARLLHEDSRPVFLLGGKTYELASDRGYRNFWAIYHRPPEEEHRAYLLERRDSLLPLDERSFKGAFYTPLHIVDKAYDAFGANPGQGLAEELHRVGHVLRCGQSGGEAFRPPQCLHEHAGSGRHRRDARQPHLRRGDEVQYDYLNDDVDALRQHRLLAHQQGTGGLATGDCRCAGGQGGREEDSGVDESAVCRSHECGQHHGIRQERRSQARRGQHAHRRRMEKLGYAARELFVQFLVRIQRELPGAVIAMFSTLKYVTAPNFDQFRDQWTAEYFGGFVVHGKVFDG